MTRESAWTRKGARRPAAASVGRLPADAQVGHACAEAIPTQYGQSAMPESPRRLDEIDTPAAVIDLDLVKHNIETMASMLRDTPVHIRPHVKTHKTPQLAHMQIAAGAPGVTAAKLGEAEAMVEGGVTDILIANQIVGATKIERLGRLAERATLTVAVDDAANVADLSAMAQRRGVSIGAVVEIEIGMKRCGIAPGRPVVELARSVLDSPGLELVGLMGYEGHTVSIADPAAREAAVRRSLALVIESKELCEAAGIEIREVTGGATNTVEFTQPDRRLDRGPVWNVRHDGCLVPADGRAPVRERILDPLDRDQPPSIGSTGPRLRSEVGSRGADRPANHR